VIRNLTLKSGLLIVGLLLGGICSLPSFALVVLQYHHISESAPKATSISPALFEAHLQFLEDNKFRVIDISELNDLLSGEGGLPDGAVIITFDDGYRSIYSEAFPRLKKRGWPFTVFVNSKPHDEKNARFMSWKQLKEMSKNGATIANHTDSHLHMIRRLANEETSAWLARMEREMDFAEKRIKDEIGSSPKYFAWPYGEYNDDLLKLLEKKKYLAFGQQSGPIATTSDPQLLPRFPFGGPYGDMDDFATKVFSLPLPVNSVETESPGHGRFVDR
jgi:peptidoglycan/xylan/chitin deacetylase (PgdA/CDA1 family)